MIPSQMLKGILEGCILEIISKEETYGYLILQELQGYGFKDLVEGTVYPLLLRIERNGLIVAVYKKSAIGPKRKYYAITESGKKSLSDFKINWIEIQNVVSNLIYGGKKR